MRPREHSYRISTLTTLTLRFVGPTVVQELKEGGYELRLTLTPNELLGLERAIREAREDLDAQFWRGGYR